MNNKRKVTKRIAVWFLSLAMVLTMINLPVFTTEAKAEVPEGYLQIGDSTVYFMIDEENTLYIKGEGTIPVLRPVLNQAGYDHASVNKVVIDEGITEISAGAFSGFSGLVGELIIPDSVTTIGDYIISGCPGINEISIPCSISPMTPWGEVVSATTRDHKYLEEDPFKCSICNQENPLVYEVNHTRYAFIPTGRNKYGDTYTVCCSCESGYALDVELDFAAFYGNSELRPKFEKYVVTKVVVLDGAEQIQSMRLSATQHPVNTIVLPETVKTIAAYAFRSLTELKNINIPFGVTSIGDDAFSGDGWLFDINIPCTVTAFGDDILGNRDGKTTSLTVVPGSKGEAYAKLKYADDSKVSILTTGEHQFVDGVCACGETESAAVVFHKHSITLSDDIGVNFRMKIAPEAATADAYMEFTITGKDGKTETVNLADAKLLDDGRYQFTYYVNAIQMADTITATYHYGELSVSEEYSVQKYIEDIVASDEMDAKTKDLAKSLADYGYYAQLCLSETHGWTIDTDHKQMIHYNDSIDTAIDLSAYKYVEEGDAEGITKVNKSLRLDYETAIKLLFTVDAAYDKIPDVEVTDKNNNPAVFEISKQSDGRYCLIIPKISAHKLGDVYTVVVDGTKTIKMSALSYAEGVLASEAATESSKVAVSALYTYYEAAMAFKNK